MSTWLGKIVGQRESLPAAEILIERLQDSLKVEDRRKTIAALKSAATKENHAVIGKAVHVLVNLLKSDRADIDIIRDTIEILIAIMTCENGTDNSSELQATDTFMKEPNNVATVLSLLEEKDYYIRYGTTQLVTTLLTNKSSDLQDAILLSPLGILRLMDLLGDQRDVIRNEALLLLIELTHTNQEIQKIVAFEGAFEKLLDIIQSEGSNDGGIVVQDCLKLINNLLRANVSNQNYFRESNCIKRIPALLEVQNSDMWILTDNKFSVLMLTLDLISLLVHGSNPSSYSCQTILAANNVHTLVVRLGLGKMSSAGIRCKALSTLADIIRTHPDNLSAFAKMSLLNETSKQTQPSLLRLTLVLLTSKDLAERLAALYVFQSYLLGNEEGQLALASTLAPVPTTEDNPDTAPTSIGGYLLRALLGWVNSTAPPDQFSAWLSACVLSAILTANNASKELLLRISLEIQKPVPLMTKSMRALTQSDRLQADPLIKVGILRMLCVWLDHSPVSVKAFLSTPTNLPFLVEVVLQPTPPPPSLAIHVQALAALLIGLCYVYDEDEPGIEFNRSALYGIITHRIGDKYYAKLDALRKTEDFIFAEQGNQDKEPSIRYYDYEFTLFYKDAYGLIKQELKAVHGKKSKEIKSDVSKTKAVPPTSHKTEPIAEHKADSAVLATYKELCKHQETELNSLKDEHAKQLSEKDADLSRLAEELERTKLTLMPVPTELRQQQQQNTIINQNEAEEQARMLTSLSQAYNQLQERLNAKEDELIHVTRQLQQQGEQTAQIFVEDTESASASSLFGDSEKEALRKQVVELQARLNTTTPTSIHPVSHQVDEDNRRLQEQLAHLSSQYNQIYINYEQLLNENARVTRTITHLSEENDRLRAQATQASQAHPQQLVDQNEQLTNQNIQLSSQIQAAHTRIATVEAALQEKEREAGQRNLASVVDNTTLKVTKLEMLLKEQEAKYESLEKEQSDLVQCLTNTELENINLQERIKILEGTN